MYTWEIKEYIKLRDYKLTSEEINLVTNSKLNPQIKHVKFDAFSNSYYVDTKEIDFNGNIYSDGYSFGVYDYKYERINGNIVPRRVIPNSCDDEYHYVDDIKGYVLVKK